MRVALVTGSSRGIGAQCARALAKEGYAVCINCVERTDKAEALAEELKANGANAIWQQADVADALAVREMVARTEYELGHISLLVNNAGIAKQQQFQDIEPETWKRIFDVNLGGCFNTIQAVLPHMLHEHSGCIINMSSIWGVHGASCEVAYSSTKHAIVGLTRSLAAELRPPASASTASPPALSTPIWFRCSAARRLICSPMKYRCASSAVPRTSPRPCCFSQRASTPPVRSSPSTAGL